MAALLGLVATLVFAGCRLDADIGINVNPDGSGALALRAAVDADVVAAVPSLRSAVQLQDVAAAGWSVSGPEPSNSGGLHLTISHSFASLEDANALLAGFGPPLSGVTLARTQTETEVITELAGALTLPGGELDAFADSDLLAALGGPPFAAELEAAGVSPASAITVDLRVELPGRVQSQSGGQVNPDGGAGSVQEFSDVVLWSAPLDGSSIDIAARSVYGNEPSGGGLPGWVGIVALIAAALWVTAGGLVATRMWQAQQRRRRHWR